MLASTDTSAWDAILWIQIGKGKTTCIKITGATYSAHKSYESQDVCRILDDLQKDGKYIVVLDGYAQMPEQDQVYKKCRQVTQLPQSDCKNRRLLVVSSMQSRGKTKFHEDELEGIEEFQVLSWTKSEYIDALEDKSVAESVLPILQECALGLHVNGPHADTGNEAAAS